MLWTPPLANSVALAQKSRGHFGGATPICPPSHPASPCKPGQAAGEPDEPVSSASECIEPSLARSRTEDACRLRAVRNPRGAPGTAPVSPGIPRRRENKGPPEKENPSLEGGTTETSEMGILAFLSPSQPGSLRSKRRRPVPHTGLQRPRAPIVGPAAGGTDKEGRALVFCPRSTPSSSPRPRAHRPHPERRSASHVRNRQHKETPRREQGEEDARVHLRLRRSGHRGNPSVRSVTLRPRLSPGLPFRARSDTSRESHGRQPTNASSTWRTGPGIFRSCRDEPSPAVPSLKAPLPLRQTRAPQPRLPHRRGVAAPSGMLLIGRCPLRTTRSGSSL